MRELPAPSRVDPGRLERAREAYRKALALAEQRPPKKRTLPVRREKDFV